MNADPRGSGSTALVEGTFSIFVSLRKKIAHFYWGAGHKHHSGGSVLQRAQQAGCPQVTGRRVQQDCRRGHQVNKLTQCESCTNWDSNLRPLDPNAKILTKRP